MYFEALPAARRSLARADVGALIHNDRNFPNDKASVFWLRNDGGSPDSWKVYPLTRLNPP